MLTVIIVDDEFHGRVNLKQIIEIYCPEIAILGLSDSAVPLVHQKDIYSHDQIGIYRSSCFSYSTILS